MSRDEASVTAARARIAELTERVCDLEAAIKTAEAQEAESKGNERTAQLLLLYLKLAYFLRNITSRVFDWRWAGVLIGTMCVSAALSVASMSWKGAPFGCVLGGAAFLAFFYVPSEPDLSRRIQEARNKRETATADCRKCATILPPMRNELISSREELRQLELGESSAFRRQQLVRRDWKSLRSVPFESFLEEVFTELDYVVETTKITGDQGADLIVSKNAHRIAIQVKGYLHSVPNSAVQEAHTAKDYYDCEASAVVTNSRFTSGAEDIARRVGCVLIDEDTLPALILGQIDLWQLHLSAVTQSSRADPMQ